MTVAGEDLRTRLLSVDGVTGADVDGSGGNPTGVRVVLAADADAAEVGRRVQQILADHGIKARVGRAPIPDGPPPPPGAPGDVVNLRAPGRSPAAAAEVAVDVRAPRAAPPAVTGASLESLSVEETRDGVVVTARAADGRASSRRARWSEGGLHEAIVASVGDLASPAGQPLLLDVVESAVAGTTVVTVVVERVDGRRAAGAAAVETGPAFAVGKAAWQALTEG